MAVGCEMSFVGHAGDHRAALGVLRGLASGRGEQRSFRVPPSGFRIGPSPQKISPLRPFLRCAQVVKNRRPCRCASFVSYMHRQLPLLCSMEDRVNIPANTTSSSDSKAPGQSGAPGPAGTHTSENTVSFGRGDDTVGNPQEIRAFRAYPLIMYGFYYHFNNMLATFQKKQNK